jgi:hypothetical protein
MPEGNRTGLVTAIIVALGTVTASAIGFCTKVVPEGALARPEFNGTHASTGLTGSEPNAPATRQQGAQSTEPATSRTGAQVETPVVVPPPAPRSEAIPILRCRFADAPQTVFNVMADNRIVILADGPVLARREADPSYQFAWIYATAMGPRYGVDARGMVWGVHPYTGQPWQIGQCQ